MVKKSHFSIVFSPCLTTRPHLGVSEHPPNPQFQGLKIDLCSYSCPNYFSRSAPAKLQWKSQTKVGLIRLLLFLLMELVFFIEFYPFRVVLFKKKNKVYFSFHSSFDVLIITFDMHVSMTYRFCVIKNNGSNIEGLLKEKNQTNLCKESYHQAFLVNVII